LNSASWIWWTGPDPSPGTPTSVAFYKVLGTPFGKRALNATFIITAVDHLTLWVNGQPIGASGTSQDAWKSARVLRTTLKASENLFSVLVAAGGSSDAPPGFLAAIYVSHNDSTTSIIVSDSSWLASSDIPPDFPNPADLHSFSSAAVAASYGSGAWGQQVVIPTSDPSPLTLEGSPWIWSVANTDNNPAPAGTVGFRKSIPAQDGNQPQSATILLTADDSFALYLNSEFLGASPGSWPQVQRFTMNLTSAVNVFTVIARNRPEPDGDLNLAGLIVAIEVQYTDASSATIRTDSSW
ncbi:hypothetical protein C8R46DRAFT_864421, partial [Mycena filopes]